MKNTSDTAKTMENSSNNTNTRGNRQAIQRLTESALMLALATVLSFIPIYELPFGGSVTLFSQLPIILVAYRHGLKWGLGTGFAMGIIQSLIGMGNYAYIAKTFTSIAIFFLADYFIAFASLGLGGIFRKPIKNQAVALSLGAVLASFARFVCHTVSGFTIWSEYAFDSPIVTEFLEPIFGGMNFWTNGSGDMIVLLYSICYNASYMLLEMLVSVIGAVMLSLVFNLKGERLSPARKKTVKG